MPRRLNLLLASLLAIVGGTAAATEASSPYLTVFDPSETHYTTEANDHFGEGRGYLFGALRLVMDAGQSAAITYTMYSTEAAATNLFRPTADDGSALRTDMAAGTTLTRNVSAGLLNFDFTTKGIREHHGAFSDHVGIVLGSDKRSGWLLFDDAVPGADRDFDDMVVRFRVATQPVPEASTVALMLAGLGSLGVALRRRTGGRA